MIKFDFSCFSLDMYYLDGICFVVPVESSFNNMHFPCFRSWRKQWRRFLWNSGSTCFSHKLKHTASLTTPISLTLPRFCYAILEHELDLEPDWTNSCFITRRVEATEEGKRALMNFYYLILQFLLQCNYLEM